MLVSCVWMGGWVRCPLVSYSVCVWSGGVSERHVTAASDVTPIARFFRGNVSTTVLTCLFVPAVQVPAPTVLLTNVWHQGTKGTQPRLAQWRPDGLYTCTPSLRPPPWSLPPVAPSNSRVAWPHNLFSQIFSTCQIIGVKGQVPAYNMFMNGPYLSSPPSP